MKSEYQAFGRAQAKATKARDALEAAVAELQEAEAPIAEDIQRAWAANEAAVQESKAEIEAATANLARVQVEVGTDANARERTDPDPERPHFLPEEQARLDAAQELLDAANQHHEEAKERFKQGVTAEVLDGLLAE